MTTPRASLVGRYLALTALLFAYQWASCPATRRQAVPNIRDSVEVQNIGWNLAHGRGYHFDWDAAAWRRPYAARNGDGSYDHILARHGSYPTLSRPPLMPLLVAACERVWPGDRVFAAWRVVDMALCAAAGALLVATAATVGGRVAGVAVIAAFAWDPVRWMYVPGWWTEGIAFDLIAVLCWLWVTRPGHRWAAVAGGATLGLLCLDRSVFVLAVPFAAGLAGVAAGRGRRPWRTALVVAGVAVAVQLPWWARNVAVAGRFVPLGTQGGFNLPDEYGDAAVAHGGVWTGDGMRDVWAQQSGRPGTATVRRPYTPAEYIALNGRDLRMADLTVAYLCTSTASEVAVSVAGTRAAVGWLRDHPLAVPGLAWHKAAALANVDLPLLIGAAALSAVGGWRWPSWRRPLGVLVGWVAIYWAAVSATHMESVRFLIPALPPLYVSAAVGVASSVRRRPVGIPRYGHA